jgi:hypothetical protein
LPGNVAAEMKHNLNKLANARKPELYINPIYSLWRSMNEYLDYLKKNNRPRYKQLKSSENYRNARAIFKSIDENPETAGQKYYERIKRLEQAAARKRKKELLEARQKFYDYKQNFVGGGEDYLRISKDGKEVETSQNVRVSVESARLLYKMIVAGKSIRGHKIDGWTVTSINGALTIGCHNICMEDVHRVGKMITNTK